MTHSTANMPPPPGTQNVNEISSRAVIHGADLATRHFIIIFDFV